MHQPINVNNRLELLRVYAAHLEALISTHRPHVDEAAKRLEKARIEVQQLKELNLKLS